MKHQGSHIAFQPADTETNGNAFLDEDFLLESPQAQALYHDYAAHQPIIDYHNHLPSQEIAADKTFSNLADVWLRDDHYKWRAMRAMGIDERYITGDADDEEKFMKWAEVVPYTIRNPLFHWTHMELKRYFDIRDVLHPKNAASVYRRCNALLTRRDFSARSLLRKMNAEVVCTTDDPVDDLRHHRAVAHEDTGFRMLPTFRPDKAVKIGYDTFAGYIEKLGEAAGMDIRTFDDVLEALQARIDFFDQNGCRLSDHGLTRVYAAEFSHEQVNAVFSKRMTGQTLSDVEVDAYMSAILYHLGRMYAEKGWTQQFHLGALRNVSSRKKHELGQDTGFDSIGSFEQTAALAAYLDRLDSEGRLAKTILYNIHPKDSPVFATMAGNFNEGPVRGKMQFGAAWWYLDNKYGMEDQMNTLSAFGLLGSFVGMVTDSRSFLSFPRHEYFRRILCNLIGRDMQKGELPNDTAWLGEIVNDICYRNAKNYFGF